MKEISNKNYKLTRVATTLFAIFAICGLVVSGMGLNVQALSNNNDAKVFSNIKSHVKVSNQQYLIKFNACSEKTVEKPTIIVKSDKETKKIPYHKIIFSGMCKSFETVVAAKNPSKITIDVVETKA